MTRVLISNGTRTLEVLDVDTFRGQMGVLEWFDEENGCLYPMPIAQATEQGFQPTEGP